MISLSCEYFFGTVNSLSLGTFLEIVRGATVDVGHGTMNGTQPRPAGGSSLSQSCSHSGAARHSIAWAAVRSHSGCRSDAGMPRLLHPEEHLPPPQPGGRRCGDLTSLFTDPRCADALVATLACGFGLREWRVVWDLRAVSHACYHAVQNDDLWRQMYGRLREGKVEPPHIRSLLALSHAPLTEQMQRLPGLRIGVHFEAFLLGLREASRVLPTAEDLESVVSTRHCVGPSLVRCAPVCPRRPLNGARVYPWNADIPSSYERVNSDG